MYLLPFYLWTEKNRFEEKGILSPGPYLAQENHHMNISRNVHHTAENAFAFYFRLLAGRQTDTDCLQKAMPGGQVVYLQFVFINR